MSDNSSNNIPYDGASLLRVINEACEIILSNKQNTDWLTQIAAMTGSDGSAFISWLRDDASVTNTNFIGHKPKLQAEWETWYSRELLAAVKSDDVTIEKLVDASLTLNANEKNPVHNPRTVMVAIDTQPSIIILMISRKPQQPAFTNKEKRAFAAFASIIHKMIAVHKMLDSYRNISIVSNSILNASPGGVFLLLPTNEILYTNATAKDILSAADGLRNSQGKLVIMNSALDQEVKGLLQEMPAMSDIELAERQWFWPLKRKGGDHIYQLAMQIVRLPDWRIESRESDIVALLYVNDPQTVRPPTAEQLRKYYGLTSAQARVAIAVYGGAGIREAAEKLSISINTARSHLRSIYLKTGASSHAELMSVLSATIVRNPAIFEGPIRRHGGPV